MTGKKENAAGLINQDTGMITDNAGMMENSAGLIEENAGLITETSTEYTASGRRKRSKERGKDSKPRNFPLHTMKNLPQFRNKSHEEVRQYILETKGIDIGGNFNWNVFGMVVLITITIVIGGYGIWKWYDDRKAQSDFQE